MYILLTLTLCNTIAELGFMIVFVEKPIGHSNASHQYDPLEIAAIATQGVRVIEYITLIYGFLRFNLFYKKDQDIHKLLLTLLKESRLTIVTTMLVTTIIYPPIFLIPPILYQKWFEHEVEPKMVSHLYTVTVFLTHIFNALIRAVMIFVTVLVRAAWISCSEKSETANSENLLSDYNENCEVTSSLQNVFQPWFVLQWIIYFIAITEDCMAIIGVLTTSDHGTSRAQQNQALAQTITVLAYNISAFIIPYVCGTTMNFYYREYRKALQDKQKQLLFNDGEKNLKIAVNWILDKPEHHFIPTLCCLSIPLNNIGHMLTILLSLLAPVISLVNN